MNNQRIRNLTTGRLHTEIGHIYEDIETITREEGIMTHMLPRACRAMQPWLRAKLPDARFWDGQFDVTHTGETVLEPMSDEERKAFFAAYAELPSPFANLGAD